VRHLTVTLSGGAVLCCAVLQATREEAPRDEMFGELCLAGQISEEERAIMVKQQVPYP
jgi:hypothetical protein